MGASPAGQPSGAEQAVLDRASRITVSSTSPREVIVAIEESALERIDRNLARQLVELDRRLARSYSTVLADADRRAGSGDARVAADKPLRPLGNVYGSSFPDVTGMMLSIVAVAIILAGSGDRSNPLIPLGLSAALAVGCALLGSALHGLSAATATRPGHVVPETWKLLVFSGMAVWAAAGWMLVREIALDEVAQLTTVAYAVLGVCGGANIVLALLNRARWKRFVRSVDNEQNGPEAQRIDSAVTTLLDTTRTEALARFERLPVSTQRAFDDLVVTGLTSLTAPAESRNQLLALYRDSPRFSIRYSL